MTHYERLKAMLARWEPVHLNVGSTVLRAVTIEDREAIADALRLAEKAREFAQARRIPEEESLDMALHSFFREGDS